jgi:hypothetical protein
MEEEFAVALAAAGDHAHAIMIGPNALILGIVAMITIVIITVFVARSGMSIQLKKLGFAIGGEANLKLDDIIARLNSVEINVLRLNLISTENDDEERLNAGKKYIELGGNGPASVLYESLKKKYERKLKEKLNGGGNV